MIEDNGLGDDFNLIHDIEPTDASLIEPLRLLAQYELEKYELILDKLERIGRLTDSRKIDAILDEPYPACPSDEKLENLILKNLKK